MNTPPREDSAAPALRPDGTLKDASEMEWAHSPSDERPKLNDEDLDRRKYPFGPEPTPSPSPKPGPAKETSTSANTRTKRTNAGAKMMKVLAGDSDEVCLIVPYSYRRVLIALLG